MHNLGIELSTGAPLDLAHSGLMTQCKSVRSRRGHRIISISDVDNPSTKRHLHVRQVEGIPRPIPILVVQFDDWEIGLESTDPFQNPTTNGWVLLHQHHFVAGQLAWFA